MTGLEALNKIDNEVLYGVYAQEHYSNEIETIRKSLKALEIIMDLLGRHCKIELVNGGTYYQIKIKIMGSGYSFGMSITKEEFDLLKEVLEWEQ